jgi:hypothetical protein
VSITHQPLPQHPPAFPPPYTVASRPVDVGVLHRDMDTVAAQLHALEVTAVRLAEERDLARAETADALEAGLLLQRQRDRYRAERDQARRDRQDAVDTAGRLLAHLRRSDRDLAVLHADNQALRTELRHTTAAAEDAVRALADAVRENDGLRKARWWRRGPR